MRIIGKMRFLYFTAVILFLFTIKVYAEEDFPINIAVEFTDHAAAAYVSLDKGWFEDEGIRPTVYSYVTGMSLAAALGRGDIQAAYICLLPAINAYANAGVPIKIVAGTHKHGYAMTVNPARIKTVKDLENPDIRIGCVQAGGPVDAILMKTIEKYDLDADRILNKVQRMNPPMQIMAIKMGKLDASFSPEHWPAMAEEYGFEVLLASQDLWPGMQGSVLIVKEELIDNHPDVVRRLVKILAKATDWINQNPEEAARVMAGQLQIAGDKIFPSEAAEVAAKLNISPELVLRSMGRMEYTMDIDPGMVQETIDYAAEQGNIKNSFKTEDILDLRFLNEERK
ncbi:MAG TPA: ABC transporter substrate-binding protein [Desulfatiglandales bacterium]|nr:ABC transporter substrate-binding protein [Desulfatiglandales bacterium]